MKNSADDPIVRIVLPGIPEPFEITSSQFNKKIRVSPNADLRQRSFDVWKAELWRATQREDSDDSSD